MHSSQRTRLQLPAMQSKIVCSKIYGWQAISGPRILKAKVNPMTIKSITATFSFFLAFFALSTLATAQSISVYRTNTEMTERLAPQPALTFATTAQAATAQITIDDSQKFQVVDGFGASLTDSAAWLFSTRLKPAQVDEAFATLFSRKDVHGESSI
jgi:O-glycosyl hydrolase